MLRGFLFFVVSLAETSERYFQFCFPISPPLRSVAQVVQCCKYLHAAGSNPVLWKDLVFSQVSATSEETTFLFIFSSVRSHWAFFDIVFHLGWSYLAFLSVFLCPAIYLFSLLYGQVLIISIFSLCPFALDTCDASFVPLVVASVWVLLVL